MLAPDERFELPDPNKLCPKTAPPTLAKLEAPASISPVKTLSNAPNLDL